DFFQAPNVIRNPGFHRWRHAQRLMDTPCSTCFCFAPTNDQISSHCTRLHGKLISVLFWYSAQAAPTSANSFNTVALAAPVMRHVALMELPSTSRPRIWARLASGSVFIVNIMHD